MNKYLIEILKIQNSVILPGLGALMVPSQKTGKIVFNQHLKFNDGSLAKFIAEKEGIEQQEAQNKVAKFVREIEAELGKGNSYDMFEFGRFVKNSDGDVDFEMTNDGAILSGENETQEEKETVKKTVVTPADIIRENKSEKEAEALKAKKEEEVKKIEKAKKKAKEEAEKLTKKEELAAPKAVAKASPKTEDKQAKNTFKPAEEDNKKEENSLKDKANAATAIVSEKTDKTVAEIGNKVKETKASFDEKSKKKTTPKAQKKKEEKSEKKKKSKLPWIILLLLLIGLTVTGYFFKDQILAFINKEESKPETVQNSGEKEALSQSDDSQEETIVADTTHVENFEDLDSTDKNETNNGVQETESESKPVVTSSNNGSYHLIGNSFSEKSNAEAYVDAMSNKGYPAKILGRFDGLYMVSIKSYDSNSEAYKGKSSVSADASEAWVFKWPK